MSWYGIEQTTDQRYRETRIVRLSTLPKAKRWLAAMPKGFAWKGAADPTLPVDAQNFHRRFREVYEMPPGWRVATKAIDRVYDDAQRRGYRRPWIDIKAAEIAREAMRRFKHGDH